MKIYLFYIKKKNLNKTILLSLDKTVNVVRNGKEYVFYAYTLDKGIKREFIDSRKDIFFHETRYISKEDYIVFSKDYDSFDLKKLEYHNLSHNLYLVGTFNEYTLVHYNWMDIMDAPIIFSDTNISIVNSLKNEYRESIFSLGMTAIMVATIDGDLDGMFDVFDMIDNDYQFFIMYNEASFNIQITMSGKEINLFIHYFGSLLK